MTSLGLPVLSVDPRTGSGELLSLIKRRGVPAKHATLPAADFAFSGLGPGGQAVRVGIERKKLSDVLTCIQDGRFAGHQLPLLLEHYDVRWLVVEGSWRAEPRTGLLQVPAGKGGWVRLDRGGVKLVSALDNWLFDMIHKAGVLYWHTWGDEETADFVARQYHWWCLGKGWESHKAHLALHKFVDASVWERQLGQVGRTAASLPGVGGDKARKIQEHFKTVKAMVNAPISEWRKVLGVADTLRVRKALAEVEESEV